MAQELSRNELLEVLQAAKSLLDQYGHRLAGETRGLPVYCAVSLTALREEQARQYAQELSESPHDPSTDQRFYSVVPDRYRDVCYNRQLAVETSLWQVFNADSGSHLLNRAQAVENMITRLQQLSD